MSKIWKKLGLLILIVACLFNIVTKVVNKESFADEVKASAEYTKNQKIV